MRTRKDFRAARVEWTRMDPPNHTTGGGAGSKRMFIVGAAFVVVGIITAVALTVGGLMVSFAAVDAESVPPEQKAETLSRSIDVVMAAPFVGMAIAAIGGVLVILGVVRALRHEHSQKTR